MGEAWIKRWKESLVPYVQRIWHEKMDVEMRESLKNPTWATEETVDIVRGSAMGRGDVAGLKGQNIPSAPRVKQEQQSCITRKHLQPHRGEASVYRRLIDIPFVPWKVLIYRTRTNCLALICAQSWEMKLSPRAGIAHLRTKHVSLKKNGNLFSLWQWTWLCLILVLYRLRAKKNPLLM